MTHWAGQYVPQTAWPAICGPAGYRTRRITDAEGKDCNVFHGDYTGLAVDSTRPRPRRLDRPEPHSRVAAARPYTGGPMTATARTPCTHVANPGTRAVRGTR